jgi:hypothetical protein
MEVINWVEITAELDAAIKAGDLKAATALMVRILAANRPRGPILMD